MSNWRPLTRRGFTLVEMLVSIVIIGVLMALMVPAIQYARESGRRAQCQNNLKQIGTAFQEHYETFGSFPPGWVAPSGYAWSVFLLPYLGEEAIFKNLDADDNMTSPAPAGSINDIALEVFICPTDPHDSTNFNYSSSDTGGYKKSNYLGVHADRNRISQTIDDQGNGIFGLATETGNEHITDGTSNTFAVGERKTTDGFQGGTWMRAINGNGSYLYAPSVVGTCGPRVRLNSPNAGFIGFGSAHSRGTFFLFADGSVHYINDGINRSVYRNLARKDDGKTIKNY